MIQKIGVTVASNLKRYACHSDDIPDLANLSVAAGSWAYVWDTGAVYLFNGESWVEVGGDE